MEYEERGPCPAGVLPVLNKATPATPSSTCSGTCAHFSSTPAHGISTAPGCVPEHLSLQKLLQVSHLTRGGLLVGLLPSVSGRERLRNLYVHS